MSSDKNKNTNDNTINKPPEEQSLDEDKEFTNLRVISGKRKYVFSLSKEAREELKNQGFSVPDGLIVGPEGLTVPTVVIQKHLKPRVKKTLSFLMDNKVIVSSHPKKGASIPGKKKRFYDK